MPDLFIVNGTLVLPDRLLPGTALHLRDDRIVGCQDPPAGARTLDAGGGLVLPGLIDIHYHGRLLFPEPRLALEAVEKDADFLPRTGVTRFCPTLATAPIPVLTQVLKSLAGRLEEPPAGAQIPGLHLEGVFLNPEAAGAHPPALLADYDPLNPEHRELLEAAGAWLKIITFAPERPGGAELARFCRERGVVAACGHSAATLDQVREFTSWGVCHLTHLFNGMSGVHHRAPGVAAAGLVLESVTADFICDGAHLAPDIVRLILRARRPERLLLITDRVMLDESDSLEPNVLPDGRLAGSRLTLIRAVHNLVKFTGVDLPTAVRMASLNPARLLGREAQWGSLEPGKMADLCLLDPEGAVQMTLLEGRVVHQRAATGT